MKISVILATFNGAAFIQPQLQSLCDQTKSIDELIVQDDHSDDDTADIVRRFADRLPISLEINPQRQGIHGNFQRGFERATGDILMPCDQDDIWLPGRVRRSIEPFERDPHVTLSICQSLRVDQQLNSLGQTIFEQQAFSRSFLNQVARGEGRRAFLRHPVAPGHAMAIARSVLPKLLPFAPECIYDQWLAYVASMLGKTALIDEPLVHYRNHDKQSVGRDKTLLTQATVKTRLDHLQRQINTLELLRTRVGDDPLLLDKIAFLRRRQQMRATGLSRISSATSLLARGKYHKLGRGLRTFARDLLGRN